MAHFLVQAMVGTSVLVFFLVVDVLVVSLVCTLQHPAEWGWGEVVCFFLFLAGEDGGG